MNSHDNLPPKKKFLIRYYNQDNFFLTNKQQIPAPPQQYPMNHFSSSQDPCTQTKHPFSLAIKHFFDFINEFKIGRFHYSEILRVIAQLHCNEIKINKLPTNNDLYNVTLFLYEKAVLLEPLNETAQKELDFFQQSSQVKETEESKQRKIRYKTELAKLSPYLFFLLSIDKYVDRLRNFHSQDANERLQKMLTDLSVSEPIKRMIAKHVPQAYQQLAANFFSQKQSDRCTITLPN